MSLASYIKSADWKAEKHVPAITVLGQFVAGQPLEVEVAVGKEIPHPNTVEHHIAWVQLLYVAEGSALPIELGRAEFSAHGSVATASVARFSVVLGKPGKLIAVTYCNLHGLWEGGMVVGIAQTECYQCLGFDC